jgi:hypothetical protein
METLIVVETRDGWCLFEQGVPNEVVLQRVS